MRLSNEQMDAIREEILALDPEAQIYLYGSRADDHARGGDIDLWVRSSRVTYEDALRLKVRIKERIGWQRIDLTVGAPGSPLSEEIQRNGIRL